MAATEENYNLPIILTIGCSVLCICCLFISLIIAIIVWTRSDGGKIPDNNPDGDGGDDPLLVNVLKYGNIINLKAMADPNVWGPDYDGYLTPCSSSDCSLAGVSVRHNDSYASDKAPAPSWDSEINRPILRGLRDWRVVGENIQVGPGLNDVVEISADIPIKYGDTISLRAQVVSLLEKKAYLAPCASQNPHDSNCGKPVKLLLSDSANLNKTKWKIKGVDKPDGEYVKFGDAIRLFSLSPETPGYLSPCGKMNYIQFIHCGIEVTLRPDDYFNDFEPPNRSTPSRLRDWQLTNAKETQSSTSQKTLQLNVR